MTKEKNKDIPQSLSFIDNLCSLLWKKKFGHPKVCIRKWAYILFSLLSIYLILFIYAKEIETIMSFPGMRIAYRPVHIQGAEKISFTHNQKRIDGIYIDKKSDTTIYYFHGNGGPLAYFEQDINFFSSLGYNVAAVEYPGYGISPGFPYEENLEFASNAFFNHLKKTYNLREENTFVVGYSIGSAVALDFASGKNISKLILISPLASRIDMSQSLFGIPIQKLFFLQNSFNSIYNISLIQSPTLIIHGAQDTLIPFSQGKKVFSSSKSQKKYFIEIEGWGHDFIISSWGSLLQRDIQEFLQTGNMERRYYYIDEYEKNALQIEKKVFELDLTSDSSTTKFINPNIHFINPLYIPTDLVSVKGNYIVATKSGMKLQKEALKELDTLGKAFFEVFGKKIYIVSGFRSYEYQVGIKQGGCPDSLCAKPGHSEHQSGLAIDIFEASTEQSFLANSEYTSYFEWLNKNAHTYGFHNTYQKGIEIDGYLSEPWHWRYVGVELATYLKENNLTLAEFYASFEK